MKNMERERFEESWKDAFDKAEVSPSDRVWTNIELDLEKANGGDLKRRLMFYQMVAAASVLFAIAIGGVGYYFNFKANQTSANQLAVDTEQRSENLSSRTDQPAQANDLSSSDAAPNYAAPGIAEGTAEKEQTQAQAADPLGKGAATRSTSRNAEAHTLRKNEKLPSDGDDRNDGSHFSDQPAGAHASLAAGQGDKLPELPRQLDERNLPPLYIPRKIAMTIDQERMEVDPVVAMLAKLEQREREVHGKKEEKKESIRDESLWTSIGFAAGSFNSVQGSVPGSSSANYSTAMALAAPIVDQETKASGYSYSMGVNVGARISERWVLQGGVNYLTHSSDYTANNVIVSSGLPQQQRFRAATPNEVLNVDDLGSKLAYSAPYTVNNSMRYLSIPMQAGYLLVNKTFGLQLNAGVATDLFLQNTIEADSDQLDKTSQPGGSDSPYRSVNLSGLLGTEFSYRFSENYRISLNPGIRYPFNTIYKSELGVNSTPLTFDIGLRFRYIFR
jgi:hypothetical protein